MRSLFRGYRRIQSSSAIVSSRRCELSIIKPIWDNFAGCRRLIHRDETKVLNLLAICSRVIYCHVLARGSHTHTHTRTQVLSHKTNNFHPSQINLLESFIYTRLFRTCRDKCDFISTTSYLLQRLNLYDMIVEFRHPSSPRRVYSVSLEDTTAEIRNSHDTRYSRRH